MVFIRLILNFSHISLLFIFLQSTELVVGEILSKFSRLEQPIHTILSQFWGIPSNVVSELHHLQKNWKQSLGAPFNVSNDGQKLQ